MPHTTTQDLGRREPAELVQRLTLEQKIRLLTGADFWTLHGMDEVGLRPLVVSDGPVGVRGESLDERQPSANTPSPTSLAASWNEDAARRMGRLLGAEARRKGADVVLAPVLNLQRTPYGGRHFEAFSEDPLLTARIGRGYIAGMQDQGVGACAKHFVANDSETARFTLDAQVDERALREVYLAPFEAAVREARVWTVMAAYNAVNGTTMTESPILRDVLQAEWGFDGVTMTDWFAGRSLEPAANAGLELCMPGPWSPWVAALVEAVRDGRVHERAIDDKVVRILRLAQRAGALEGSAPREVTSIDVASVLRSAAAEGMVLLRDEERDGREVLPLGGSATVALIGRHAVAPRTLGGGSAQVAPPYVVTPLEGLRAALGDRLTYSAGVRVSERAPVLPLGEVTTPSGSPGVELAFLAADGTELRREDRAATSFLWFGDFGDGLALGAVDRVELRARVVVTPATDHTLGVASIGPVRVVIDGAEAIDTELRLPAGSDVVEGFVRPPQSTVTVPARGEGTVDVLVVLEVPGSGSSFEEAPICILQLVGEPAVPDEDGLELAVRAAELADVAVVVVGTAEDESEGFDRSTLALPGRQDELVQRVAAANPRTVVVVNSGAPVLLPWRDDVAAVLLAWFPGQEFGHALADVLTGVVEPGGRLPVTWPDNESELPSATPVDGVLAYTEGLLVGHRAYDRTGREPAYRFGAGRGYTSWSIDSVASEVGDDGAVRLTVDVTNTGRRPGSEVVQVYASRPGSSIERPDRWLAGFTRVHADAASSASADVLIARRSFEHWAPGRGWQLERGEFVLHVGRSSGDLSLTTSVDLTGSPGHRTDAI